jgi:peptidoglycan/xylan/chitin deacetylase (PgdA/CDA1 family)
VFRGLYRTGCLQPLASRALGGVRYFILAYHGISTKPLPLFTSAPLFESHLNFFARWGTVASMDEVADLLSGRTIPSGPKIRFVITFDDGYANIVRNAVPLLRQYRRRGIVFVNPAWAEKPQMPWVFRLAGMEGPARQIRRSLAGAGFGDYGRLADAEADVWPIRLINDILKRVPQESFGEWWNQAAGGFPATTTNSLLEAQTAGWEELASACDVLDFGSHTWSHSILGLCRDRKFIHNEVVRSKSTIEERLGQPCPHFAYPRGQTTDFNEQTNKMIAEAGHRTAVTTVERFVTAGTNPFEIPRFYVSETPVAELAAQLSGVMGSWDKTVEKLKALVRS